MEIIVCIYGLTFGWRCNEPHRRGVEVVRSVESHCMVLLFLSELNWEWFSIVKWRMEFLVYYYLFDYMSCMNVWIISCYYIVLIVCTYKYMHGEKHWEELEWNTEWREYVYWESEIPLHCIV